VAGGAVPWEGHFFSSPRSADLDGTSVSARHGRDKQVKRCGTRWNKEKLIETVRSMEQRYGTSQLHPAPLFSTIPVEMTFVLLLPRPGWAADHWGCQLGSHRNPLNKRGTPHVQAPVSSIYVNDIPLEQIPSS
jgi:hypothetical protein